MGNENSGRWRSADAKTMVEECSSLDTAVSWEDLPGDAALPGRLLSWRPTGRRPSSLPRPRLPESNRPSIADVKGFPDISVYSATKAAVRSFARTWTRK